MQNVYQFCRFLCHNQHGQNQQKGHNKSHYFTLFLQTQKGDADAQSALQGALPTGVATSKSVDGLSISYDLMGMTDDLQGYGTWKLTSYGQQLVTLTKIYGHAGMWVNG